MKRWPLTFKLLAVILAHLAFAASLLFLTACSSPSGTGAKWYAPATWFSHRPADNADKANQAQDKARDAAVKAAQRAVHETAEALAVAPASRPVEVATESNAAAVALLDQSFGSLTLADLTALRKQVAGLLSDNVALRAEAEKARSATRASEAALSQRLAAADAAATAAQAKLREAYDRENALANELRAQRALAWILGSLSVVALVLYVYAKVTLGRLPQTLENLYGALGSAKRMFETSHPEAAKAAAPIYARFLDTHHQHAISRASK